MKCRKKYKHLIINDLQKIKSNMPHSNSIIFQLIKLLLLNWFINLEEGFAQNIPPKPEPAVFVNDFAAIMEEAEEKKLEIKLKKYADSTSTQIAIVIIQKLEGYSITDYAQKLAETWGIGQKGKDNGLLILVSKDDRKIKIAVGYGLEATITDLAAKHIIDNQLVPNFKTEDYYQGLEEATDFIFKLLNGEFKADDIPRKMSDQDQEDFFFYWYRVVMILGFLVGGIFSIFILDWLESKNKKLRQYKLPMSALGLLPMLLGCIYLMYIYYAWVYFPWVLLIYVALTCFIWFISNSSKGSGSSQSYSGKSSSYSNSSSSYSDSSSSYSDSSFGGGSFGGGGASGSW
jgi:uncharacterized protein